jgi:hypothetical protein
MRQAVRAMTRRDAICRAMCQRDPCCLGYPDHNADRFTPCRGFGSLADRAEAAVKEWERQAVSLNSAATLVPIATPARISGQ